MFNTTGVNHPPKPMMHIAYSPYFHKIYKFSPPYSRKIYKFPTYFRSIYFFGLIYVFVASPSLTMMHLFIMFYTYRKLDALLNTRQNNIYRVRQKKVIP